MGPALFVPTAVSIWPAVFVPSVNTRWTPSGNSVPVAGSSWTATTNPPGVTVMTAVTVNPSSVKRRKDGKNETGHFVSNDFVDDTVGLSGLLCKVGNANLHKNLL